MNSEQKIQQIYNETKSLTSPDELDHLILGKISATEETFLPEPASNKLAYYLPIAASVLLAVFIHFNSQEPSDQQDSLIKTAQTPLITKTEDVQKNNHRNQLPEMFFLPHESIDTQIVPACNGQLIEPDGVFGKLIRPADEVIVDKTSEIPLKLIYPTKTGDKMPECDSVAKGIFK